MTMSTTMVTMRRWAMTRVDARTSPATTATTATISVGGCVGDCLHVRSTVAAVGCRAVPPTAAFQRLERRTRLGSPPVRDASLRVTSYCDASLPIVLSLTSPHRSS
jgi:hypothetical protein